MGKADLTPSETMQIRELLTIKNLILTKSVAMEPFAVDESLKIILQNEIGTSYYGNCFAGNS